MTEILSIATQKPTSRDLGLYLFLGPSKVPGDEVVNQYAILNFTGPIGSATNLYYSFVFWLLKQAYNVQKIDEWIEISPTHAEYYQRVMSQKAALEGSIKTSLAEAAKAISDYELIAHDLRRYKEIMDYFNKNDEHTLRTMFIDNVDIANGQLALISLAQRWPTILSDFQRLSSDDVDVKKIQEKLKVTLAEASLLRTKNVLYNEWKALFRSAVIERYERLLALAEARKKTIEEYKQWVKPYLVRYKMMKTGYERPEVATRYLRSFADLTGQATFANVIKLWAFKPLHVPEQRPAATVREGEFLVDPYDSFVRENFILNKKTGLAKLYPWLADPRRWCPSCNKFFKTSPGNKDEPAFCPNCNSLTAEATYADELVSEIKSKWAKGKIPSVSPNELYYVFHDIDVERLGTKTLGSEIEDITFTVSTYVLSQNILLVRLLELKCHEILLERHIEEMMGVSKGGESISELVKREFPKLFAEKKKPAGGYFDVLAEDFKKMKLEFAKWFPAPKPVTEAEEIPKKIFFKRPGPYETDFFFRITKHYLSVSGAFHGAIVSFLEKEMGIE